MTQAIQTLVLVGRPNVGKSTLFNRFTKTRDAIVGDRPGLTRDRNYGVVKSTKGEFLVVDTGGLEDRRDTGSVEDEMARQADQAILESDLTLFLVDVRDGLTNEDKRVAERLRKTGREIWLVANKAEGVNSGVKLNEFYELGLGVPRGISASHGDGVRDLIAQIEDYFNLKGRAINEKEAFHPKLAVVGRPNVGKSTLVNSILGEERMIAFDEPGTTRDAVEVRFQRDGKDYSIIDTAGVRRRGKVKDSVEKFSVIKALQAIEKSNVVVLVIDATEGVSDQDVSLAAFAIDAGRAIVVALNKWDAAGDLDKTEVERTYRRKLRFLDFAKVHQVSAVNGTGLKGLLRSTYSAFHSSRMNLPTPQLNRVLKMAIERQSPPRKGYVRPKLRYAHQGGINPPLVVIHGNSVDQIPESYRRYLETAFTNAFKLRGTKVRVTFKQGRNPFARGYSN